MLTSRILSAFQGFRALSIRNVARDLHTMLAALIINRAKPEVYVVHDYIPYIGSCCTHPFRASAF